MTDTLPRRWQELTHPEFARLDPARTVAILPVAAIEQHGPHLATAVDACLVDAVLDRALALAPPDLPLLALPTQAVGKSNEHLAFPGTLTLSAETLARLWTEIGESVHRAGLRKLVLFNSHGGQVQIMDIVARDLRVRFGMMVVKANWWGFGYPPGLYPETELRHGIHAGSVETSMMLAVRPDLVRKSEMRDYPPASVGLSARYKHLNAIGPSAYAWAAQDLNPAGAAGNAADADAARGRTIIEHAARGFAELLAEIVAFPLEDLRPGPLSE